MPRGVRYRRRMSADPARLEGPPGSAAVAAGSAEVVAAATRVLQAGGNAVDAALAGAFAAPLSEPVLASLGGGGFLMWTDEDRNPHVLDFFVDVPGLTAPGRPAPERTPQVDTVVVDFARTGSAASSSTQVFHGGWGTVAVPGCLDGYLVAHARAGRLPLRDVVGPAVALATEGVDLSAGQRTFMHLVNDLLALTTDSQRLFANAERTGRYRNLAYAMLLRALASGTVRSMADHAFADPLLGATRYEGGLLTAADLDAYRPEQRTPLQCSRAGATVWTNPPPSVGGSIVAHALTSLAPQAAESVHWAEVAAALADATAGRRGKGQVPTGTTHVSVVDREGRFAAITTSNGSGSGCVVPGWGVPLNNMLGEEDLRPADGSPLSPGERMRSMMAPTVVALTDGSHAVLGTGGSERIRSALLGVLVRLIDDGASLTEAIAAPRVHVSSDGTLHHESGLSPTDEAALQALANERGWGDVSRWPGTNLFFGGVHAVRRTTDGAVEAVGDARRSGSVGVVHRDGSIVVA